jgi:phosphopantothenoylcysteine decarboxylase/phosphopantothenate--cysteine ligase
MSDNPESSRPRVVLGVSGGIAAYKACELLRLFTESGHDVTVVPTASALEFVGAPTWAALSGKPVRTDVWADVHEVPHVRLGQTADLVVVAPATANTLAKAAHGLADDLLTCEDVDPAELAAEEEARKAAALESGFNADK